MRADLHMHTVYSDGELVPAELIRRAKILGHDLIAITDHVDATNVEWVAEHLVRAADLGDDEIRVLPGVEITHVRPARIAEVAKTARRCGAAWIVVHGETPVEPVEAGTNRASVENPDIDVLAHPGMLSVSEAEAAKENGVLIEISGRMGHNIANGHVCSVAREAKADMVVDSDAHAPEDLMSEARARLVARGAGLTELEAEAALRVNPYKYTAGL